MLDAAEMSDRLPDMRSSTEHRLIAQERVETVWRAVETLSERAAQHLLLRILWKSWSSPEIGRGNAVEFEHCEIIPDTVRLKRREAAGGGGAMNEKDERAFRRRGWCVGRLGDTAEAEPDASGWVRRLPGTDEVIGRLVKLVRRGRTTVGRREGRGFRESVGTQAVRLRCTGAAWLLSGRWSAWRFFGVRHRATAMEGGIGPRSRLRCNSDSSNRKSRNWPATMRCWKKWTRMSRR